MSVEVRPPSFVHDLNTCVGCHACVIACVNENQLAPGFFWRQVVSFNADRVGGFPTFHLSLACNHCLDAPCLRYCPALAISRDALTGAVTIDAHSCIGCRYCSWVCPYDAPRFNSSRGVMEKCTLCNHRLRDSLAPACASLCPTGALRIDRYEENGRTTVAGFSDLGVRPAIRFVPLRRREPLDASPSVALPATTLPFLAAEGRAEDRPKISLRSEWTLAAFTFTAIVLVAWLASSLVGGPAVTIWPFLLAGTAAMGLSTLHLGHKERAWRAMLNWRRSWLSREVIGYASFLGLATVFLGAPRVVTDPSLRPQELGAVGWTAVIVGLLTLLSVDRVYAAMARPDRARLDDGAAMTSAAFLAGVLAGAPLVFLAAGVMRLMQWTSRRHLARRGRSSMRDLAATVGHPRVLVGLALPLVMCLAGPLMGWVDGGFVGPLALAGAIGGELVDRCDFYDSLEVVTPSRQMAADFADRVALVRTHPEYS